MQSKHKSRNRLKPEGNLYSLCYLHCCVTMNDVYPIWRRVWRLFVDFSYLDFSVCLFCSLISIEIESSGWWQHRLDVDPGYPNSDIWGSIKLSFPAVFHPPSLSCASYRIAYGKVFYCELIIITLKYGIIFQLEQKQSNMSMWVNDCVSRCPVVRLQTQRTGINIQLARTNKIRSAENLKSQRHGKNKWL